MDVKEQLEGYEQHLLSKGFARNTLRSYLWTAAYFMRAYGEVSVQTLARYRDYLSHSFKDSTANQRVQAINCFLAYLGRDDLKLRSVCVRQTTFLENAIDSEEYRTFTEYLRRGGFLRDHFAVRIMATTGMRVSELLTMQVGDVERGYMDIRSKGKLRRVYFTDAIVRDVRAWVRREGRGVGPLFLNRYGRAIAPAGLAAQLKVRAAECGVDGSLVHPHAFRHLFAKSFLEAGGDVVFLADLLGHSSVETTRRYLRHTADEQRERVNQLVTW